jgi:hypothetical protein
VDEGLSANRLSDHYIMLCVSSLTSFHPTWYTVSVLYSHERRRTQMNTDIVRLNNTSILWVRLQMAD